MVCTPKRFLEHLNETPGFRELCAGIKVHEATALVRLCLNDVGTVIHSDYAPGGIDVGLLILKLWEIESSAGSGAAINHFAVFVPRRCVHRFRNDLNLFRNLFEEYLSGQNLASASSSRSPNRSHSRGRRGGGDSKSVEESSALPVLEALCALSRDLETVRGSIERHESHRSVIHVIPAENLLDASYKLPDPLQHHVEGTAGADVRCEWSGAMLDARNLMQLSSLTANMQVCESVKLSHFLDSFVGATGLSLAARCVLMPDPAAPDIADSQCSSPFRDPYCDSNLAGICDDVAVTKCIFQSLFCKGPTLLDDDVPNLSQRRKPRLDAEFSFCSEELPEHLETKRNCSTEDFEVVAAAKTSSSSRGPARATTRTKSKRLSAAAAAAEASSSPMALSPAPDVNEGSGQHSTQTIPLSNVSHTKTEVVEDENVVKLQQVLLFKFSHLWVRKINRGYPLKADVSTQSNFLVAYVEMSAVQKLKYNHILKDALLMSGPASPIFSGRDVSTLAELLVLLRRVCFHESLVRIGDARLGSDALECSVVGDDTSSPKRDSKSCGSDTRRRGASHQ